MKIMVTGAAGQLGRAVCNRLGELGIPYKSVDINDFDLTNECATRKAVADIAPECVIHCAAYTAVDRAETEKELCYKVNVLGTANVVKACMDSDARMMYISTEYVFDGKGDMPFEVDHPKSPLNIYGMTKAKGEDEVSTHLNKYFIVRISWLFGLMGNNFVKTMLSLGQQRESMQMVTDQIGSPTFAEDLAILLSDMIQTNHYGIYHATNEGFCSRYEFASNIMQQANMPCRLDKILTSDYPTPASRPLNSKLSKRSLDKYGFNHLPSWQDALKRYLEMYH